MDDILVLFAYLFRYIHCVYTFVHKMPIKTWVQPNYLHGLLFMYLESGQIHPLNFNHG